MTASSTAASAPPVSVCSGHNWLWFDGASCGSAGADAQSRAKYEQERLDLQSGQRVIHITSLTYGGTDQIAVLTVHLARELNVLNMACARLPSPCPFSFILPIVRDLTPTAPSDAMYLFSEPSRAEVPMSRLFDVEAMQRCSRVRITQGLSSLQRPGLSAEPEVRTHVVLPFNFYTGPLLSHTDRRAMQLLLAKHQAPANAQELTEQRDSNERIAKLIVAFDKTVNRFLAAASRYREHAGIHLTVSRFTVLPDPSRTDFGSAQHVCHSAVDDLSGEMDGKRLDGKYSRASGCGAAFFQHIARHEANNTLVVFITTESSQQCDLPVHESLRQFWRPSGNVGPRLLERFRIDEAAVADCFRLAPRFTSAVDAMLQLSDAHVPILTWQLRVEKLSLTVQKHLKTFHSYAWYQAFTKSIQEQVRTLQSAARACNVQTILWESDLIRPSATMLTTIFGPAFNRTVGNVRLGRLRDGVFRSLTARSRVASKAKKLRALPIRVVTTDELLVACNATVQVGHPLEPFARRNAKLLNVERALFAVAVMARTTYLVRSPVSSSFSGWANAIRTANGNVSNAAWGTDDGTSWWKCTSASRVKMGQCRRPKQTVAAPRLCD